MLYKIIKDRNMKIFKIFKVFCLLTILITSCQNYQTNCYKIVDKQISSGRYGGKNYYLITEKKIFTVEISKYNKYSIHSNYCVSELKPNIEKKIQYFMYFLLFSGILGFIIFCYLIISVDVKDLIN
jgi:hypothetical protein